MVFCRDRKIIEKDVARTDRDHPYFRGDGNPNLRVLQRILLATIVHDPQLGMVLTILHL